jgi:hypothetical protein
MDKKHRKALVKRWKNGEQADLLAAMPFRADQLHRLLDYLDARLESCDHTTKLTAIFLREENLEEGKVLAWLAEHGEYCDCEVLANLEDLDESLQAPAPVAHVKTQPKKNRQPRDLHTVTGWNLSRMPVPWRVANLYQVNEPLQLQLGKKGGCAVQIIESPLPIGDQTTDQFWSNLWHKRTELPQGSKLHISHGVLDLPDGFQSILARSPSWTPVYCWIVPQSKSWYLEVITELNRFEGDLPQISSLIFQLARSQG